MNASTTGTSFHMPVWVMVVIVAAPVAIVLLIVLQKWLTRKMETQVTPGPKPMPVGCLASFASVFVLAGLAAFFFITVRPTYRSMQASRWPTTQGTVISSQLGVSHDSDGHDTFRVDIHYRYFVAGRDYDSNQYDSTGTHTYSGNWSAKQSAVKAHHPGKPVTVHYDPTDPADAMLGTAIPPGTFAFLWFPVVFCTLPVLMIYIIYRANKNLGKPTAAKPVAIAPAAADARGKRRKTFIGILIFAIFWNGFVTVFWLATHTWCIAPFALIGVAIAVMAGQTWLGLFNPLVNVSFSRMPIHPGDACDVAFVLDGNVFNMRSLSFKLEGREKVTYSQGTSSRTETKPVYTFPLLDTTKNFEMERGRFTIKLPADVMTSFTAKYNAFSWHLVCHGEIPRRPDIKDEFDVTVLAKEGR